MTDEKPSTAVARVRTPVFEEAEEFRAKLFAKLVLLDRLSPELKELKETAESTASWLSYLITIGLGKFREEEPLAIHVDAGE